jgi:hypothetical protein
MDRELARKQPAQIVATTARVAAEVPTLPRRETLERTFHQRADLVKEVHKLAKRGQIGTTYKIRQVPSGGWRAEVIRIREPGIRWRRVGLIAAGALLAAGGILWLAALALQALATALAAVVPLLLGFLGLVAALAVLGLILSASGGSGGGPVQNNYFR